MKAGLAAQSLSRAVENVLEFVSTDLKLSQYSDIAVTFKFIQMIDRLFDVFNAQNRFTKEYKLVIKPENEKLWRHFLVK